MPSAKIATIAKMTFTMGVNRNFRSLCEKAQVSHKIVAEELGIAERTTQSLFNGNYPYSLSADTAAAIADFFGVSMDSLRK